jgi:hypothetical protein
MPNELVRARPKLSAHGVAELSYELFAPLIDHVRRRVESGSSVFHYTTIDGLVGIIENDALQASNIFFMNDSSEVHHGLELIASRIEEVFPAERSRTPSETIIVTMFERFAAAAETVADAYVSCFCRKDDLLSQWRAYGNNETCYSIKFSARSLFRQSIPTSFFAPVQYLAHQKIERVDRLIEGAHKTLSQFSIEDLEIDEETIRELLEHFSYPYLLTALFMKHEAFKEECEWRLVYFPWMTESGERAEVEIKARSGIAVPYVNLRVQESEEKELRLPISQIRVGPSSDANLAIRGLTRLLEKYGRSNIAVIASQTPLR